MIAMKLVKYKSSIALGILVPKRCRLPQAPKIAIPQNQVIEQRNRQKLRSRQQLSRQSNILGAWLHTPRGVIVRDNRPRRPLADHLAKNIPWVSQSFRCCADRNYLSTQQPIFHIQQHHSKTFLRLPHQILTQGIRCRLRRVNHSHFRRPRLKHPPPHHQHVPEPPTPNLDSGHPPPLAESQPQPFPAAATETPASPTPPQPKSKSPQQGQPREPPATPE